MISIIIPAYNAERTIGKCLGSIFAQTYRDYEVIVVDDGSTDGTAKIVLDKLAQYSSSEASRSREVHLIKQENRGANAARNRGWQEVITRRHSERSASEVKNPVYKSTGSFANAQDDRILDYVLFCDADIVLRPDCLENMVRALEEHPEVAYAYASFKFGWKTFKLWPFDAARLRRMPYIHTASLIRYSAIVGLSPESDRAKPCGPFDESIKRLQDWDLWLTMLEQGHTGIWIPEVLFRVINPRGTMSQWLPSFAYKLPKWLGLQSKAVSRYNEAVARIKEKHHLV